MRLSAAFQSLRLTSLFCCVALVCGNEDLTELCSSEECGVTLLQLGHSIDDSPHIGLSATSSAPPTVIHKVANVAPLEQKALPETEEALTLNLGKVSLNTPVVPMAKNNAWLLLSSVSLLLLGCLWLLCWARGGASEGAAARMLQRAQLTKAAESKHAG
mmetsp:Transcript_121039/g.170275  ORF Transcript_121039/g.170275 Transcript_121039/m.170275 type:complete len:159 (+) Transcript_121039:27-503(+)|eukprot:s2492_g3.t1